MFSGTRARAIHDVMGIDEGTTQSATDGVAYGTLLEDLVGLESRRDLLTLIARKPEVLGPEMLEFLETIAVHEGRGILFRRQLRLVKAAQDDPESAWNEFTEKLERDNETSAELGPLVDQINTALAAERPREAIALAEPAIGRAREAELGLLVAAFEAQRAEGLLVLGEGDRRANVEEAIAGFRRALSGTVEPTEAARIVMRLAVAFAEQIDGDPADNADLAIEALRDALSYLDDDSPLKLRDDIRTNLANALGRRERGERSENLREGVALCRDVLAHRSAAVDGSQWGRAQLNLAGLLRDLELLGEAREDEVVEAYEMVISAVGQLPDWQVAMAHFSLGRRLRVLAVGDDEGHAEVALEDPSAARLADEERVRVQTLEGARVHLVKAGSLAVADPDPVRTGRIDAELADVLHRMGDLDGALEAARRAFGLLTPLRSPRECAGVAGHLGHLLALRQEWDEAASAFRAAVECAELNFNSRMSPEDREGEAKRAGNLTRWAAFALAAVGEPIEAAIVLESGRTREIGQRLGLPATQAGLLDALPEDLRDAYLDALSAALNSSLGPGLAPRGPALQEALTTIRSVSGFEEFASRSHADDLLGALEPGWPLVYVDPTPYGTLLLAITEEDGAASAEAVLLGRPDSNEVFMRLMFGDRAETPTVVGTGAGGSYLLAASGLAEEGRDIQPDIEHVLPWLGEALAEPIADYLAGRDAEGVTLVPCGPVSLAPLHAAAWQDEGCERRLIDDFEIRYSPSAVLGATCLRRSRERTGAPRLLALADPDGTLTAAKPEVEAIASGFPSNSNQWKSGAEASWTFLRSNAAEATHIHIAGHASARMWGERETAILLGDGPVDLGRLTQLAPLSARVVTISACQSAVVDIGHLPEEGFSVGGAMIAAGSACAIASLWPVRSDTTALLMMRLYEEMLGGDLRPPEALRRAQTWLRDLTDPELDTFLEAYPALKAEFRRRAESGDRPGRRTFSDRRSIAEQRPFSGPDYWAPFIALGA
jgi:CHAT domain-containing protein/tetratricopeptide (TPR) repeat protein